MVKRARLPGKSAFIAMLSLANDIVRLCDSFVSAAAVVKNSELGELARVAKIVDISSEFTEARAAEPVDERAHSFLTHAEAVSLVSALPIGAVGAWLNDGRAEVFLKTASGFERIVAMFDGAWRLSRESHASDVVPSSVRRAELLIFESVG
jgi:hypothetical protein